MDDRLQDNPSRDIRKPTASSLDSKTAEEADRTNLLHIRATYESFSGPLPPPDILSRYNDVLPNAAERIFKMTESQAKHRQALEHKEFEAMLESAKAEYHQNRLGTYCGFGIATILATLGVICILSGHDWAGVGIGTSGLCGIVATFVLGPTSRKSENSDPSIPTDSQPTMPGDKH